jgi:hypothetical protein
VSWGGGPIVPPNSDEAEWLSGYFKPPSEEMPSPEGYCNLTSSSLDNEPHGTEQTVRSSAATLNHMFNQALPTRIPSRTAF